METSYSEKGGAKWGTNSWLSENWSWPFATLTITQDYILLLFPLVENRFEKKDIQEIRVEKVLWATGIRIKHSVIDCPKFIVFFPSAWKFTKAKLEEFGYKIKR